MVAKVALDLLAKAQQAVHRARQQLVVLGQQAWVLDLAQVGRAAGWIRRQMCGLAGREALAIRSVVQAAPVLAARLAVQARPRPG